MVSYEFFFFIILISLLSPFIGLLILIIFNAFEKQIYFLEVEKVQALLEKELEAAKYIKLNQQIQPHFLFNALNSMFGLIRLKKYDRLAESFEHMILYLRSKYNPDRTVYSLEEEIEYTKHYIAIQQLRFGERLKIDWQVEGKIGNILIVPYLLQTLVENAFKHGVENVEGDASVKINIRSTDKIIIITVQDNGPGFLYNPLGKESEVGIGLINVSKRLELLFGEEAKLIFILANTSIEKGGKVVASFKKVFNESDLKG